MFKIIGRYTEALVTVDEIDLETRRQIETFLGCKALLGSNIVIMPDCHAGKGSVVGYTQTINDYVIPNVVGVDIGCGVLSVNLGHASQENLVVLDQFIRKEIPYGFDVHKNMHHVWENYPKGFPEKVTEVCSRLGLDKSRVFDSIGSLGGGNHFIELAVDTSDNIWLSIHSGSRNFGKRVAEFHQKIAQSRFEGIAGDMKGLEYLTGVYKQTYLEDMQVAQQLADLSRVSMAKIVVEDYYGFKYDDLLKVHSIHNYIDFNDNIIRKGAIAAYSGQMLVIPMNMRDGVLLCSGRGNVDWNNSAPHGAGRVYSRGRAKRELSMDQYVREMEGVFSTCVNQETLDESPMAYKDPTTIRDLIDGTTVDVIDVLKPIYNFKAS